LAFIFASSIAIEQHSRDRLMVTCWGDRIYWNGVRKVKWNGLIRLIMENSICLRAIRQKREKIGLTGKGGNSFKIYAWPDELPRRSETRQPTYTRANRATSARCISKSTIGP